MKIITTDSPEKSVLYQKAQTVTLPLTNETIEKIEAMRAFYKTCGDKSGFAAPQVGISERIILVERHLYDGKKSSEPTILINPEWTPLDNEKSFDIEGCLSVPDKSGSVERYLNIKLTAHLYIPKTRKTKVISRDYRRVFSCALWQHEIDHLNGEIYTDKAAVTLDQQDMDLILQYLFQTGALGGSADVFDMGNAAVKIAKRFLQQEKPLMAFLQGDAPQ